MQVFAHRYMLPAAIVRANPHTSSEPFRLFFFFIPSSMRTHTPVDSISSSQLRLQARLGPTALQLTEGGGGRPYLGPRPVPRPCALAPGAGGGRCHSGAQCAVCLRPQSGTFERFGDGAFLKSRQGAFARKRGHLRKADTADGATGFPVSPVRRGKRGLCGVRMVVAYFNTQSPTYIQHSRDYAN